MSVHLCHKLWINCWYINLSNWFTISPSPLHAVPSHFKSLGSAPGGANYSRLSPALSVLGMMMHSLSTLFPAIPGRLLEYSNCSWRCCFAPSTPVAPSSLRSQEHKHILLMQPKGYEEKGGENKIAKLKKGLYGLKQAGQEWYTTLHNFLIQLGFCWTHADHSVFVFIRGHAIVIIPVYVDDKLLSRNDEALLDSIQDSIGSRFKATILGDASWILGIWVCQDIAARSIFIDQSQYIKGVLTHYGMENCTHTHILRWSDHLCMQH